MLHTKYMYVCIFMCIHTYKHIQHRKLILNGVFNITVGRDLKTKTYACIYLNNFQIHICNISYKILN